MVLEPRSPIDSCFDFSFHIIHAYPKCKIKDVKHDTKFIHETLLGSLFAILKSENSAFCERMMKWEIRNFSWLLMQIDVNFNMLIFFPSIEHNCFAP